MASVYGDRPPWHDVQAMIQGPAVGDVEAVFRERWDDPAPPTRNPVGRLRDLLGGVDDDARRLPPQLPDPPPQGTHAVQLLRTYPYRRRGYAFAPHGERSIARGYLKVLPRARSLVYLEDQYLWSSAVVAVLARALRGSPGLRLIAVIPRFPDQDGRLSMPPNLVGRIDALETLQRAGGDRVAVYSPENQAGTPVYVHAKVCVVDDTWAIVGSDNFNRRSWTHDSELSCAVIDQPGRPAKTGSAMAPALTRTRCAPPSAGSISAVPPTVSWTAPTARSRRSARRPPGWKPGTRTAGAGPGHPGGCAATSGPAFRPGPPRGPSCPTG